MGQLASKRAQQSVSPPSVTASAMLHASGLPPSTKAAPPVRPPRRASRTHLPTPPLVPAPPPSKPKQKAAVLESSSAAASYQSADVAPMAADAASVQFALGADSVPQPTTVGDSSSSSSMPAAALPNASSSAVVPEASSSAAGQSSSNVPEAVHDCLPTSAAKHVMASPDPAVTGTEPSQQQQMQPQGSTQVEGPVAEHAAVQTCSTRSAAVQTSRPSSSSSKHAATTSSYDRRLALLHKGLPTHLPPPSATPARPVSRSRRASATGLPAGPPSHPPSAELDPTCLLGSPSLPTESNAAADAAHQDGGAQRGADAHKLPSEHAAVHPDQQPTAVTTPTGMAEHAGLDTGASLNKPSSPTSVLPSQGLGLGDTTYHNFYGLAEAYPELYRAAAAAGRAQKANSRALQCFVGDTLKGNPNLWKQQLKSAYTMCNDRLKHDAVGQDIRGERHAWPLPAPDDDKHVRLDASTCDDRSWCFGSSF